MALVTEIYLAEFIYWKLPIWDGPLLRPGPWVRK